MPWLALGTETSGGPRVTCGVALGAARGHGMITPTGRLGAIAIMKTSALAAFQHVLNLWQRFS